MSIDYTKLEAVPSDGSHLNAKQVRRIERYVAKLTRALDLSHWRVPVSADLPPEGARLAIYPTEGRRLALLAVSAGWYENTPPSEKRSDLTHEVLHLATHDHVDVIRRFKNGNGDVGDYPMSLVYEQFVLQEERMVDSLSYVLAPLLPEWKHS